MGYEVKVILDSISPSGVRLTTIAATFPRFILAEMNTHRMFSRNTASSRAIPVEKMIQRVKDDPFIPESWPKNQAGMQSSSTLSIDDATECREYWIQACRTAIMRAEHLNDKGVHKQIVNRLLEPFSWTTQLITATEWDNFFKLRCHPDAQPEMQKIACMIRDAHEASTPEEIDYGWWHLPYLGDDWYAGDTTPDIIERWKKLCVARCARVSYLTHEGKRDIEKDLELFERLKESGHWSPFEHVATPLSSPKPSVQGNFRGWKQYRKEVEN